MKPHLRLKTALLAAASLTAAGMAVAHAAERAPMEPVRIEYAVNVADHGEERIAAEAHPAKHWAIAGAAAAALAALARLIGFKKINAAIDAAAPVIGRAANAAVRASGSAVRAIAAAAASPFRFALLMGGLALVALTGVGFYDVEWAGGLAVGAVFTGSFFLGARRFRKVLTIRPARPPLTAD